MTFDDFIVAELPSLARFAGALTGDRDVSHDIVLDALDNARRRWRRLSSLEDPAAYVRRIVVTNYIDHVRKHRRRREIDQSVSLRENQTATEAAFTQLGDRDLLRKMLIQLRPHYRAALVLRYYLDLPTAEVARHLGIAPSAARTCISRALKEVRVDLESNNTGLKDDKNA